MNLREYHKLAMRTSPRDGHDKIDNGVLGLIGEAGELVDVYKKWIYQSAPGAELPIDRIADELGDVIWYLVEIADGMDKNIADVIMADFDRLEESAARAKTTPSIRWIITGIAEAAIRNERAVSDEKMPIYMHLIMEHAAQLARLIKVPLAEIARRNIDKLLKRYPVKFDPEISEARYK